MSFTGWAVQEIWLGSSGQVILFSCSTGVQACCSAWASTSLQITPPQFLTATKGGQGCQGRCEGGQVCSGSLTSGKTNSLYSLWFSQSCTFSAFSSTVFSPWPGPGFFQGNTGSLPDSCIHVPHTENKLARQDFPSQRPCWFFLYSLCLSMCSLISYFNTGSSILTTDERQTQSSSLEPCLWMGLAMLIFQPPDSVTPCNDRLHILASSSAISHLSSFTALGWMAANPGDLLSSNLLCVVKFFLYT